MAWFTFHDITNHNKGVSNQTTYSMSRKTRLFVYLTDKESIKVQVCSIKYVGAALKGE